MGTFINDLQNLSKIYHFDEIRGVFSENKENMSERRSQLLHPARDAKLCSKPHSQTSHLHLREMQPFYWSHLPEMRKEECCGVRFATERCISPRCVFMSLGGYALLASFASLWDAGLNLTV